MLTALHPPFAPQSPLLAYAARALAPLLAGALLLACNGGGGDDGGDATATNGDSGSGGDDGGVELICSASKPCPAGQFCFNGICAVGCLSNSDCAADQYCDTEWDKACKNKQVPTCTKDDECAGEQICVNQYCTTPPPSTSCDPEAIVNDGCAKDAVCFADPDTGKAACYTMPRCGEGGACPVGVTGAICNEGYLPDKDAICLLGLCDTKDHCPAGWSCVRFGVNDPLGMCSDGAFGSPCSNNSECTSGVCSMPFPGIGFCG